MTEASRRIVFQQSGRASNKKMILKTHRLEKNRRRTDYLEVRIQNLGQRTDDKANLTLGPNIPRGGMNRPRGPPDYEHSERSDNQDSGHRYPC
jgi:hypothetical protein